MDLILEQIILPTIIMCLLQLELRLTVVLVRMLLEFVAPMDRAGQPTVDGASRFPSLARLIDGGTPAIGIVGLMRRPGAFAFRR